MGKTVGVLGGNSLVGKHVLESLDNFSVYAFSRNHALSENKNIVCYPLSELSSLQIEIPFWVSCLPIWVLVDYLKDIQLFKPVRVVALSSTSCITKEGSDSASERDLSDLIRRSELEVIEWAKREKVEFVILRPTMIYGNGIDKNVAEIARLIRKFHFFPILGRGIGLRQPVHAADVAHACFSSLFAVNAGNRILVVTGGEQITYREMVLRIFSALNMKPRILTLPEWSLRLAVLLLSRLPRYHHWNYSMFQRLNRDLCFDCNDAIELLGYCPQPFKLNSDDLPV